MSEPDPQWLLLLHQIPPTPPYFRARVLRRLNRIGALAIKNSVYILPECEETKEDFEWLRSEISERGGEAWLVRGQFLSGLAGSALVELFQEHRSAEYTQLLDEMQQWMAAIREETAETGKLHSEFRKLKRRFDEIRKIDFFEAAGKKELEEIMDTLKQALEGPDARPVPKPDFESLAGKTWVTRRGIKVDRIATAWLVQRFVDAAARFRFVDPDRYTHSADEIRFDMFEGEFTHEGNLCTFEVLLLHLGIKDPALDALAQVIHDIDLKDEKYQRPETNGIASQIGGIALLHTSDEARLEHGSRIFEASYAGFKALGAR